MVNRKITETINDMQKRRNGLGTGTGNLKALIY